MSFFYDELQGCYYQQHQYCHPHRRKRNTTRIKVTITRVVLILAEKRPQTMVSGDGSFLPLCCGIVVVVVGKPIGIIWTRTTAWLRRRRDGVLGKPILSVIPPSIIISIGVFGIYGLVSPIMGWMQYTQQCSKWSTALLPQVWFVTVMVLWGL